MSRTRTQTHSFSTLSVLKTLFLALSLSALVACGGAGDATPAPKSNEPNTQQKPKPNKPTTKPSKPKPQPSDTDTTAPSISSINPADNAALGSASNKKPSIEVRFSENVKNVNDTNVLLKQGANPVAVTITGSGATYSIKPNVDLVSNKPYTLEFKAGIKDVAGNALVAVSKSYNTADWVIPTISNLTPADGSIIGTASNKRPVISVTFSENVQNVNTTNVLLKQGTTPVAVTITGSGASYSIKPNVNLVSNKPYTLEFKAGIKDAAGNALAAVSKSYNTPDWVAPTVALTPANNATNLSVMLSSIGLNFSEVVTGVNTANVLLSKSNDGSNPVALTASGSGSSYSFTLSTRLDYDTEYFIVIKAANIKDAANNPLGSSNQVTSFRTYKQKLSFSAWVGSANTLLDINGSLPSSSELYSYRGANYNDCNITNIGGCNNGQTLVNNGSSTVNITNTAHTLTQPAFYKLKEGSLISTGSSENSTRFSARSSHQAVWFKNKFWIIGGNDRSRKNDVWSSADGVKWMQVLAHSASPSANQFSGRFGHQVVVANIDGNQKLWLIGGNDGSRKNDVWSSTDGVTWTQATANAGFSAREGHQVVVANIDGSQKLWLIGGRDGSRKNDVWSSTDGVTWTQATANAGFSAREGHQVVVANIGGSNKLWLIGGNDGSRKNDVWTSTDGVSWTQATANASFTVRYNHQVVVANIDGSQKLWLIGGHDGNGYKNDVWSSTDGASWTQATASAGFSARFEHQVVVSNIGGSQKLYMMGGIYTTTMLGTAGTVLEHDQNDVWRSADGATWRKAYFGEITRP